MRVFVTGATGFIGSLVVQDLIQAGHQVLGLARSDGGVRAVAAAGAEPLRGDLQDLPTLRSGAAACDGVIHTAFMHGDMNRFEEACAVDRQAIETLAAALAGTGRPLVVTSGMSARTEDDAFPAGPGAIPRVSEQAALAAVAHGVRAAVVRVPQVHDRDKQGLVGYLIAVAREKGVSAYVGDGANRWPAVHRADAALLYRRVLEQGAAGARYHAIAEEGVALRAIAEAIGRGLGVPVVSLAREQADAHFGWLAFFAAMDAPASSALTTERIGWRPLQRAGLIDDIDHASAFGEAHAGSR